MTPWLEQFQMLNVYLTFYNPIRCDDTFETKHDPSICCAASLRKQNSDLTMAKLINV